MSPRERLSPSESLPSPRVLTSVDRDVYCKNKLCLKPLVPATTDTALGSGAVGGSLDQCEGSPCIDCDRGNQRRSQPPARDSECPTCQQQRQQQQHE